MMKFDSRLRPGLLASLCAIAVVLQSSSSVLAEDKNTKVDFNRDIRPLLADRCVGCHGGVMQAGSLSFIYRDKALAEGDSGTPAIVPFDAEASELIVRINDDESMRMPPADHGTALSADEIELLTRWINQGAEWAEHWAFVNPQPYSPPTVQNSSWCRDPLDQFILASLENANLEPTAEAGRAEWLRRVSFDLTGIPPTLEEQTDFLNDTRPNAYERVVDRLLASPHFGERWTGMWLDLARYADTRGYEADQHRDIWPYRDWLIREFNADLPYDEFTIRQIAGDLLPQASVDDRVASAFHRNTQSNTEGGTDDEEFRLLAVLDRVSTTWQVWQATTFACTQCHSHPYDPIEHEEFYQFVALFNTSRDIDVPEDFPRYSVPNDPSTWQRAAELDHRISEIHQQLHAEFLRKAENESNWSNLKLDRAEGSEETQIEIFNDEQNQVTEYRPFGTIANNSLFTLEAPIPQGINRLTAVRLDALPMDLEAALKVPEAGFAVSNLKVQLLVPGEEQPRDLTFSAAWCDEVQPELDPMDSLKDGGNGWADYSRMSYPRFAVFLLEKEIDVPEGSRIRFEVRQSRVGSGGQALVIRRGRIAVSSAQDWQQWLNSSEVVAAREELATKTAERNSIPGLSIPVMHEQSPNVARKTHLFLRGNWMDQADAVEPGFPSVMNPLPSGFENDRLGAAHWIVSPENPLTARVWVNRLWEQLFGLGIVETVGDFGTSGSRPTHPELLDYLALQIQNEHNWSTKDFLKRLVLSATYRQAGTPTAESLEIDPRNRLLSRGPRQRLQAEMIRDQALQLSGRFSTKQYGPPVMPPQPDGLWRSVYNGSQWENATDENRYRRAVYTYWKRTSPYPSMMTFDAPSREVCMVQRIPTNTPLQALVTLNDPAYIELAGEFAVRIMAEGGTTTPEQISWAYSAATGRSATPDNLNDLCQLHDLALREFESNPDQAKELADTPDRFAMSIVANAILNLDEVLTK